MVFLRQLGVEMYLTVYTSWIVAHDKEACNDRRESIAEAPLEKRAVSANMLIIIT